MKTFTISYETVLDNYLLALKETILNARKGDKCGYDFTNNPCFLQSFLDPKIFTDTVYVYPILSQYFTNIYPEIESCLDNNTEFQIIITKKDSVFVIVESNSISDYWIIKISSKIDLIVDLRTDLL